MRNVKTWMLASVLMAGCGLSVQAQAEVNIGFKYDYTKYSDSGSNYSGDITLNQYMPRWGRVMSSVKLIWLWARQI